MWFLFVGLSGDREHEDECSSKIGDDRRDGIEVVQFEGRHANREMVLKIPKK